MKKFFKVVVPALLSITAVAGLSSCSEGRASLLREPTVASAESDYTALLPALKSFAASFGDDYFSSSEDKNAVISPLSAYMALSLASRCAAGDTNTELLTVLGTDEETLEACVPSLYSTLNRTFTVDEQEMGRTMLTNSVWYDSGIKSLKSDCLDALSSYYGAYSYQADFAGDNAAANNAVRNFIKEKTNNLIDRDWNLSEETLLALVNTLYVKDIWDVDRENLSSFKEDDFLNGDGSSKNVTYYSAYYRSGQAASADGCQYFYSTTANGFRITFVKPDEGKSVSSVLTDENIEKFLAGGYVTQDDEKKEYYETRCIFPEFTLETNGDIAENLKRMGVNKLFDVTECDFSSVTDETVFCKKVQHAAKLIVNKKGIEGAAVTVVGLNGSAAQGETYTTVYENFILDRSFGVVLSYRNIPLFIGSVYSL